jgi:hypothetical protein
MIAPNGCRLCGIEQRGHAIQASANGSHAWTPPTQTKIKERMLARRAGRNQMMDQPADEEECRAAQYASVLDSYNGSALCGCPDCAEYVAEREYEDEV